MKPIDQIIITCCHRDFWLTRICVASIRYWYPDVPIGLLKDTSLGDFSTLEIETAWNVFVAQVPRPPRGPYTKLEAFYLPGRRRILLLDSDIIFLGRVLDILEKADEDFVVNWGGTLPLEKEEKIRYAADGYYDLNGLKKILPDYEPPDYFFNAGHMLITTSIIPRERVEHWLTGSPPHQAPSSTAIYALAHEQGILNVVITQMQQEGKCTIGLCDFVRWSKNKKMVWDFELEQIENRTGYPVLIHWAEAKPVHKTGLTRGDLLSFFEDFYYSRIPQASWKRIYRLARRVRKHISARTMKIMALSKKTIDLRKLLEQEQHPTKEAHPFAFLS